MDCLFCKIVSGDIPATIIKKTDLITAFNDITPQAPTHILIIPKSHHENAGELAANDPAVLSQMHAAAAQIAEDLGLAGYRSVFNTGASAGQSVFHAHLHLLGGRPFAWPPG